MGQIWKCPQPQSQITAGTQGLEPRLWWLWKCSKGVEGEGQGFGCNPTSLPILGCRSCPAASALAFFCPPLGEGAKVWFAPWSEGIPVCTFCAETAQRLILQEPGSDRDVACLDTNHRHRGVSLSGRKRRRPTEMPWLAAGAVCGTHSTAICAGQHNRLQSEHGVFNAATFRLTTL